MSFDINDTYKLWDLELPITPERSTLFHLKPIGIGTADVESLTSYVKRLAIAHHVSSRMLILSEIAPLLDIGYVLGRDNHSLEKIYGQRTHALNGTGKMAESLVKALERKTLCSGLNFLTMLTWHDVISQKHLIRRYQAWCPFCYQEWYDNNQIIYEPLSWSFNAINICLKHSHCLIDRCPHCLKQFPPLGGQARPGFCHKCGEWLGDIPKNPVLINLTLSSAEFEWQTFVVNNIVELITFTPHLKYPPSPEVITQNLVACVNHLYGRNFMEFSQVVNLPYSFLKSWITSSQSHHLNAILKVVYNLQISLVDFFVNSPLEIVAKLPINNSATTYKYSQQPGRKKVFKHSDLEKAQHILSAAVNELPPPSINEIAQRIGCCGSTIRLNFPDLYAAIVTKSHPDQNKYLQEQLMAALSEEPPRPMLTISQSLGYKSSGIFYALFPEICYQISRRYKEYKTEIIHAKYQEVRDAAFQVHESGQEPTSSNLQLILSKPSIMMASLAKEELRKVRIELGYE